MDHTTPLAGPRNTYSTTECSNNAGNNVSAVRGLATAALVVVAVSAASVALHTTGRSTTQLRSAMKPVIAARSQLTNQMPTIRAATPHYVANAAAGPSADSVRPQADAQSYVMAAQPPSAEGLSLKVGGLALMAIGALTAAVAQWKSGPKTLASQAPAPAFAGVSVHGTPAPGPAVAMFTTTGAVVPDAEIKKHSEVPHEALGYELVKTEFLTEYNSEVSLYKHKKTGAEVLSLANTDENKVFGITFRTTPSDSTGIPHILEHSVLCGSRKYPVKEPFVELLKGSLNTFLNAMTFPDKTCYPVASTNTKDFYNLVDVYLDAVFYPNIDEETLMQEGYHLEADTPGDDLTYKGVVFNEMKGVYSQPDSIHARASMKGLFVDPKVTYSIDSGGDPTVIPNLTFERYMNFHKNYYHPSNSRVFFYGDDDLEKRLHILNEYLDAFERNEVRNTVPYQEKFPEPRRVTEYYAAAGDSDLSAKTFLSVNWLLNWDRIDAVEDLALGLLNDMIMGSNAAPLRRALNESGLGASVIGGGLDTSLLQATYSVGMKNVKDEDVPKLESLITDTLNKIAEDGFSKEQIEASINSTEFAMRELNTGGFPKGIMIMLGALQQWLHDRDPIEPLKFEQPLATLKERLAAGEDVFVPLLKKYLLDNTHRVTVEVRPDPELGGKIESEEAARLAAIKKAMTPEEIESVIETKKKLQTAQETPDDPEALKCVPTLKVSDIAKENKTIPTVESKIQESTLLYHDIFTNNILYLDMAFDLHTLPQESVPYLPLFVRALSEFGTKKEDFVSLTQRIKRKVGGVSKTVMTSPILNVNGKMAAHLIVRGKGTVGQLPDLMEIISDILLEPEFNNQAKFKQMILETKAGMEAGLVGGGHSVAMSRLSAMDNTASYVSDQMGGLSYLKFLDELLEKADKDWPSIVAQMETMRSSIVNRKNLVLNVTADQNLMNSFTPSLEGLVSKLPAAESKLFLWEGTLDVRNEAIIIPTQVNYVAQGANLYKAGYEPNGSVNVITKYLGTTWLWDRVRVVGGAYGGFCRFDRLTGNFAYGSYRDPNLLSTVEAYNGTPDFLRGLDMSDDALNKAIIGAIGDYDNYQLPDAKGYSAFSRYLLNIQPEDRQKTRDDILSTDRSKFKEFAEYLEAVKENGSVVVVGSDGDVDAANSNSSLNMTKINPLAK